MKLLYDGACPICRRQIQWLKRRDRDDSLAVEDVSDPAFAPGRYGLSQEEVLGALHGVLPDGRVHGRRLDAIRQAYQAVGLGWLIAPIGWPLVGWVCKHLYGAFARNRVRLGGPFSGCPRKLRLRQGRSTPRLETGGADAEARAAGRGSSP